MSTETRAFELMKVVGPYYDEIEESIYIYIYVCVCVCVYVCEIEVQGKTAHHREIHIRALHTKKQTSLIQRMKRFNEAPSSESVANVNFNSQHKVLNCIKW